MSDPKSSPPGNGALARLFDSWPAILTGVALLGLLIAYPPFRVVSRKVHEGNKSAAVSAAAAVFDTVAFAEKFWTEKLLPAAEHAPEAGPVLALLKADPAAAARQYGRKVGLGNAAYFFLRGSGRVTAVERSRVIVDVGGVSVAVRTGPVFGNILRDGSGLLEINQVPGITEFNAVAAELNGFVERSVQPSIKDVAVGATLRFAGGAEAPESLSASGPLLTIIPVLAEVVP
jgi:predicted lipoprotein